MTSENGSADVGVLDPSMSPGTDSLCIVALGTTSGNMFL